MNLIDIADFCWDKRVIIPFGNTPQWVSDTFQAKWFRRINANEWVTGKDRPGWYWFELDYSLPNLMVLQKPLNLTKNACDFGQVSTHNNRLFDTDTCHTKTQLNVIYNGHNANVLSRIRDHFAVDDDSKGALGINKYPLSNEKWTVSFFLVQHLDQTTDLTAQEKQKIESICRDETGRIAIEQIWRSKYGWPVLCKS
jgi:hypothetical protein